MCDYVPLLSHRKYIFISYISTFLFPMVCFVSSWGVWVRLTPPPTFYISSSSSKTFHNFSSSWFPAPSNARPTKSFFSSILYFAFVYIFAVMYLFCQSGKFFLLHGPAVPLFPTISLRNSNKYTKKEHWIFYFLVLYLPFSFVFFSVLVVVVCVLFFVICVFFLLVARGFSTSINYMTK